MKSVWSWLGLLGVLAGLVAVAYVLWPRKKKVDVTAPFPWRDRDAPFRGDDDA